MKICLYAIAKDEIKEVDAWYESMKEADEIIVLDTGSTDGTPERLRELGVTVYEKTYPKPFRFDVARNDSVELAYKTDCDIFITTDFDERLSEGWADILKSEWDINKHARAVYDDFMGDSNVLGSLNWIHGRGWTWKFPCHEIMVRGDNKWYTYNEELDLRGKVVLRHYQDLTKSRAQYLPLLKIRVDENPDDVASWSYYMRELMYVADYDTMFQYCDVLRAKGFDGTEWAWCLIWLATAYQNTGNNSKAMELLFESILIDKRFRTPYVVLATILNEEKKYCLAEGVLKQALLDTDPTTRAVFLDAEDIWSWRLYDWLYAVCMNQHKNEEALKWITLALVEQPDNPILQTHYQSCIKILQESR